MRSPGQARAGKGADGNVLETGFAECIQQFQLGLQQDADTLNAETLPHRSARWRTVFSLPTWIAGAQFLSDDTGPVKESRDHLAKAYHNALVRAIRNGW
jgi:hypothetical protein